MRGMPIVEKKLSPTTFDSRLLHLELYAPCGFERGLKTLPAIRGT